VKQNPPSKRFQDVKGIERNLTAELNAVLLYAFGYRFMEFWKDATRAWQSSKIILNDIQQFPFISCVCVYICSYRPNSARQLLDHVL